MIHFDAAGSATRLGGHRPSTIIPAWVLFDRSDFCFPSANPLFFAIDPSPTTYNPPIPFPTQLRPLFLPNGLDDNNDRATLNQLIFWKPVGDSFGCHARLNADGSLSRCAFDRVSVFCLTDTTTPSTPNTTFILRPNREGLGIRFSLTRTPRRCLDPFSLRSSHTSSWTPAVRDRAKRSR